MNVKSADQQRPLSTESASFVQDEEVPPKAGFAHALIQTDETTEYQLGFADGKTVGFHQGKEAAAQEIIEFCDKVDREFQEAHDRRAAQDTDSGTV